VIREDVGGKTALGKNFCQKKTQDFLFYRDSNFLQEKKHFKSDDEKSIGLTKSKDHFTTSEIRAALENNACWNFDILLLERVSDFK